MRTSFRRLITAGVLTLGTLGVLGGSVAAAAPAAPVAAAAHPYTYFHS